jgi:hypothetical protein
VFGPSSKLAETRVELEAEILTLAGLGCQRILVRASVTLGTCTPIGVSSGGAVVAEIALFDLPHYPDDRGEWLESFANNPGVRALKARVSSLPSPKVCLTIERLGLDRGLAILRELVAQTNDLVGDPDERRLQRFDVRRAEERLYNSDEAGARP